MKTSFRDSYGAPDGISIRDAPVPEAGPGEVLVRVHAATVSRTDCAVLLGRPYVLRFMTGWPQPRHKATGTDFAGVVAAVGPGEARFAVGDRIMGLDDVGIGSHAEYLVLSQRQAARLVPDGVDLGVAAASMEGAHYARNFMNKVPLKAGDAVLVYGATGAIGSAAVALLREAGAEITAVCATEHHAAVAALGADRLLDYQDSGWLNALSGERFDYVLDAVGKLSSGYFRPVLKSTGAYISSELGPWGQNVIYALAAPLMRGPKVRFPVPTQIGKTLDMVAPLLAQGRFKPLIDRSYGLDELRDAFEYVASGRKIGNVLLKLE